MSPTVEANSAVKLRSRVSENIRIPVTNATPSTIAKVLSSSRTRRASRLLREARIMRSDVVMAASRAIGVEDLLAGGAAQLVDDAAVGEEEHPVGPRRGDRVVGDHHDGLAVVVDAAAQQLEHLGARGRSRGCRWARRRRRSAAG